MAMVLPSIINKQLINTDNLPRRFYKIQGEMKFREYDFTLQTSDQLF